MLLSLFNAAVALLGAAVSGRRGTAIASGAVVFAAGYQLAVLVELADSLAFAEDLPRPGDVAATDLRHDAPAPRPGGEPADIGNAGAVLALAPDLPRLT